MNSLLPRGSVQRAAAIVAVVYVALHVLVMFVLPGQGGNRGTPLALVFEGAVNGSLTAMAAMGLVLIYRTARYINFAQAAMGTVGAIFAYNTVIVFGLPWGVAFVIAAIIGGLVGIVVELFLRKFFDAPRLVVTILTIGLAALLSSQAVGAIANLPIFGDERNLSELFGQVDIAPWPSFDFTFGDFPQPYGLAELMALVLTVVTFAGITAFFRFTRVGVAVRASAENSDRAELLGINVRSLSTIVWAIAGGLSAMALFMFGSVQSFSLGGQGAPTVLVGALAAAVIARMRSLPVALAVGLAIGVVQRALRWSFAESDELIDGALFVVIAVGLLLQRRDLQRSEEASSWEATEEVRPTPKELLAVPGIRNWRRILVVLGVATVLSLPFFLSIGDTNLGGLVFINAIVLISIVVLTGWAGQVSLSQYAFVAIGAVIGGALTERVGIPFWFAVPIAAVVTAIIALVVGLPALRIKGLFLAVATFAFAVALQSVLFNEEYFGWLLPTNIERPTAGPINFEDERSMYYLCLAFLIVVVVGVLGLRRTRPGRVLIAMRENETELQSFGINLIRTKLAAFALSGFLCGIAGALFAHHQRSLEPLDFGGGASIDIFVYAVLGGVSSISGALLGGFVFALDTLLPRTEPVIAFFLSKEFLLILILYVAPGGLAAVMYSFRDAILKIVAQRRQLIVPALFEDLDVHALEHRLIPLAEGAQGAGLDTVPRDRRYRLRSELYDVAGNGALARAGRDDDAKALGAAAERATGED